MSLSFWAGSRPRFRGVRKDVWSGPGPGSPWYVLYNLVYMPVNERSYPYLHLISSISEHVLVQVVGSPV
jgi:hypothetical protein